MAHYELGKLLADEQELAEAERELNMAVQLQPDLAPALYALSRTYAAAGKKQEAADTMKRFAALKSGQLAERASLAADTRQALQEADGIAASR